MKPFKNMSLCWSCKKPLMTGDQGYWCRYCREKLEETKRKVTSKLRGKNDI